LTTQVSPRFGERDLDLQIAPKILADLVRWSFGAEGRVPRLAQRRVILFFWPIRASSLHDASFVKPMAAYRFLL